MKNKEVFLYLLFGILSFALNLVLFALLNNFLNINELVSNAISWIVVVMFAFVTNRSFVFDGDDDKSGSFIKQMIEFYSGRVITLLIEEGIIFVFITRLEFPSMTVKLVAQIIVIVLNYFISKLIVFKKR